ncbi:CDF family Co(II)/Ni(II) efflux transporter DmeF [Agrobacterium vitis]|uniref:Cation diffusion facilitator family transporter n=1 Tax=Agrobacterium vitis TaxID=373 RepID=A0A368NZ84_AGRVI|nr:CDF family Co(II)/Ni(II) efflux transporter DmeF [Agrobacterium vitis]KAA3519869.1 cation diffusion facilitator family transporter [Agrobacterium vitis]KAA3531918.1 cation diffusion facilitator family transporter [Agrobacterium vitis]MCF1476052.1 CDF family Co(II)/Ni(II) efflux transporter DmeF [Agrobacterium vitis]MUZ96889.1 CDF family Co(II)/Ni(II) efflux transporter DmeF [Agrobacterium vitis]MVA29062.1 CDF family Co(II)/Ni(II) efflux transporter DmeF [Agrobacterium vitis]
MTHDPTSHGHDSHGHGDHPHPLGNRHSHVFLGRDHQRNERRTWAVIGVTTVMMVVEIVAGNLFGSMALTADGWHMATHAGAIFVSALAYSLARRHADNSGFTFGTGKFGDLAAFSSAIFLGLVAVIIAWESLWRVFQPVAINFSEAIVIAIIGLAVNLVCALLLQEDHHHGHKHAHDHGHHEHGHHAHSEASGSHGGRDRNLRAAYIHVLADALTSVMAIAALLLGSFFGWLWLDPLIGVVGALVIGSWAFGLMRDSGMVLLDHVSEGEDLSGTIRRVIEAEGADIADLHVWQLGPGHHGAIVSLVAHEPQSPAWYREKLSQIAALSHVTVEVERAEAA